MMFWIRLVLFYQLLIWIQIKVPVSIAFIPLSFDLILLSVIFVGLCFGGKRGFISGIIAGFFLDSLSVAPLGYHLLGYALIGYLSGRWQNFYYMQSIKMNLFVVFVMTSVLFVEQLATQMILFSTPSWSALVEQLFFNLLLNMLLAPLVLFLMKGLKLVVNPYITIRTPYEEIVSHP